MFRFKKFLEFFDFSIRVVLLSGMSWDIRVLIRFLFLNGFMI